MFLFLLPPDMPLKGKQKEDEEFRKAGNDERHEQASAGHRTPEG